MRLTTTMTTQDPLGPPVWPPSGPTSGPSQPALALLAARHQARLLAIALRKNEHSHQLLNWESQVETICETVTETVAGENKGALSEDTLDQTMDPLWTHYGPPVDPTAVDLASTFCARVRAARSPDALFLASDWLRTQLHAVYGMQVTD